LVYVPSGQPLVIRLLQLGPGTVKATWFEPRTGKRTPIGEFKAGVEETFDPPGRPREGNDWVLVLEKMQ
jgi:hypothetical protein